MKQFLLSLSILLALWPWQSVRGAEGKSGVDPQVLSLPSGPGSVEGLGGAFEPQLNSGTSVYAVGLEVPRGRAGMQPKLVLRYNSALCSGRCRLQ